MLATSSSKEQVIVAGRYNGVGGSPAVLTGEGVSVTDGGSGTYTVTFHRAYDSLIAVTATALTSNINIHVGTITHTDGTIGPSIIFQGNADADGTDTDCIFSFITVWEVDT